MPYQWSEATRRYRDSATGRFVPQQGIRTALDMALVGMGEDARRVSQHLIDGTITLPDWEREMRGLVKSTHIIGATTARGGWQQMTPADWGRVGHQVRGQYDYLRTFATDIASGKQGLDGRLASRSELYTDAGRSTYERTRRQMEREAGVEEERRVLHALDSCDDCLSAAMLGWQPIGTLPSIGDSVCRSRCQCTFTYRQRSAA